MNNAQIIRKARELITPREKWTQEIYAQGTDGWDIDPIDEDACKWCLLGALRCVGHFRGDRNIPAQIMDTLLGIASIPVHTFNDTHTHEEVLALLDKAAEALDNESHS